MRLGKLAQSGYTLVEIVIVIALSAIFILLVLQNTNSTRSTQQFVSSVEKFKSILHDAESDGQAGIGDSSNPTGFLCGTRLSITSTGTYQVWRIYDSSDQSSGGTLTYQSLTGGNNEAIAPTTMNIQTVIANSVPNSNADGSYQVTGSIPSTVDFVFLGSNTTAPIGQAYIFTSRSSEPSAGINGPGNCSDFAGDAASNAALLDDAYFNIYSGSNTNTAHLATVAFTTASGSFRNSVYR